MNKEVGIEHIFKNEPTYIHSFTFLEVQCPPLKRITLGQHKNENNKQQQNDTVAVQSKVPIKQGTECTKQRVLSTV